MRGRVAPCATNRRCARHRTRRRAHQGLQSACSADPCTQPLTRRGGAGAPVKSTFAIAPVGRARHQRPSQRRGRSPDRAPQEQPSASSRLQLAGRTAHSGRMAFDGCLSAAGPPAPPGSRICVADLRHGTNDWLNIQVRPMPHSPTLRARAGRPWGPARSFPAGTPCRTAAGSQRSDRALPRNCSRDADPSSPARRRTASATRSWTS